MVRWRCLRYRAQEAGAACALGRTRSSESRQREIVKPEAGAFEPSSGLTGANVQSYRWLGRSTLDTSDGTLHRPRTRPRMSTGTYLPALRHGGYLDSRGGRCHADRADGGISGAARSVRIRKVHAAEFNGGVGPAD